MDVRWITRQDMARVLEIERHSFSEPWSDHNFYVLLRKLSCVGTVIERDGVIAGFCIYELHRTSIEILNVAVHPAARRTGVGAALIQRLMQKLLPESRDTISATVRETNMAAQLFFKSLGFRAVDVLREHYDDTNEDAYAMRYCVPAGRSGGPRNRIKQYIA